MTPHSLRPFARNALLWVLAWFITPLSSLAWQNERQQEIDACLAGEIATWGDGVDQRAVLADMVFLYEHAGAPATFNEQQVLIALDRAQKAWSACGVPGRVVLASAQTPEALRRQAIRVHWQDAQGGAAFGVANYTQRTLQLGPKAFGLLPQINPTLNPQDILQMVVSHEVGHLYGLMAHSRRCVDVTSYLRNAKGERCTTRSGLPPPPGIEYRAPLPTACELARCRALNPP